MQAPRSLHKVMGYRGAVVAVCILASGVLPLTLGGGPAGAASTPSVAQVRAQLAKLNARADRLGQHYDQVLVELAAASQRLKLLGTEAARYRRIFDGMRVAIGRIAASAYEQGGVGSSVTLLTSGTPQQILNQSSVLAELSSADGAQLRQYVAASRQVVQAQRATRQTELGIAILKRGLARQKASLMKLIGRQQSLLNQLSPAQQAGLGPGGAGGGGGSTYHGPTATQAEKAVAFAYDQLGCTYYYGGTGPCHDPGFDCSGLVMEAWAAAGVSIPRTTYEMAAALPQVSIKDMQLGDILEFAGDSHVGIYVGNGYLIDAPDYGHPVEKVALSGWYSSELDAVLRP